MSQALAPYQPQGGATQLEQGTLDVYNQLLMGRDGWSSASAHGDAALMGSVTGALTAGVQAAGSKFLPKSAKSMSQIYAERYPEPDNLLAASSRATEEALRAKLGIDGDPSLYQKYDNPNAPLFEVTFDTSDCGRVPRTCSPCPHLWCHERDRSLLDRRGAMIFWRLRRPAPSDRDLIRVKYHPPSFNGGDNWAGQLRIGFLIDWLDSRPEHAAADNRRLNRTVRSPDTVRECATWSSGRSTAMHLGPPWNTEWGTT